MNEGMKELIGKEVQIYPADTYKKRGIIVDVNEAGVLFRITKTDAVGYTLGTLHFIAFSANLSFATL